MLGDNIRRIRESKKLGLNATAKKAGISGSYLSNLERGLKENPSMENLESIANALDVSVNALFDNSYEVEVLETKDTTDFKIPNAYTETYKVTSRDKKQCLEFIKKQNEAFFMNDEFEEEEKKELLDSMLELFWEAKAMNKRKPKEK